MKHLNTTTVAVTGGRDGSARSDDGRLDVALALPTALGGSGDGTNPEELFGAGFAACFSSSLAFAAKQTGLEPDAIAVAAEITLTVATMGAYGIQAQLSGALPNLDAGDAARVVTEARRICAYSNALKGTAEVAVALACIDLWHLRGAANAARPDWHDVTACHHPSRMALSVRCGEVDRANTDV